MIEVDVLGVGHELIPDLLPPAYFGLRVITSPVIEGLGTDIAGPELKGKPLQAPVGFARNDLFGILLGYERAVDLPYPVVVVLSWFAKVKDVVWA